MPRVRAAVPHLPEARDHSPGLGVTLTDLAGTRSVARQQAYGSSHSLESPGSGSPRLDFQGKHKSYEVATGRALWSSWRRALARIFESKRFDLFLGAIIVSNVIVMVYEVDKNAGCEEYCAGETIQRANMVYTGFYTVECALRFSTYRLQGCHDRWNLLDLSIVVVSWMELLLEWTKVLERIEDDVGGDMDLGNINFLRMFRVARLMRATRVLKVFPELHAMILGFGSAMKAMMWGFLMIVMMLLVLSIMTVELIYPRSKSFHFEEESGSFCNEAFESVFKASLVFFQTLVAGDSWGRCALPLIRDYEWMAVWFAVSLVSVQLGFTNLILSAIVDSASKAREDYKASQEAEVREHRQQATDCLLNMLEQIDTDDSGTLSYEELAEGYRENPGLQAVLTDLNLAEHDLRTLFEVMDTGRTGAVSYHEFIHYVESVNADQLQQHLLLARMLRVREEGSPSRRSSIGSGGSLVRTGSSARRAARAPAIEDETGNSPNSSPGTSPLPRQRLTSTPKLRPGNELSGATELLPSAARGTSTAVEATATIKDIQALKDGVNVELEKFAARLETQHVQALTLLSQATLEIQVLLDGVPLKSPSVPVALMKPSRTVDQFPLQEPADATTSLSPLSVGDKDRNTTGMAPSHSDPNGSEGLAPLTDHVTLPYTSEGLLHPDRTYPLATSNTESGGTTFGSGRNGRHRHDEVPPLRSRGLGAAIVTGSPTPHRQSRRNGDSIKEKHAADLATAEDVKTPPRVFVMSETPDGDIIWSDGYHSDATHSFDV